METDVKVPDSYLTRAAELAKTMTATSGVGEWTVQDVINAALRRGLDALERAYAKDGSDDH
jgi:3-methyladenine DNA glycosylase/8-oxoguanine DNA glycosylase